MEENTTSIFSKKHDRNLTKKKKTQTGPVETIEKEKTNLL